MAVEDFDSLSATHALARTVEISTGFVRQLLDHSRGLAAISDLAPFKTTTRQQLRFLTVHCELSQL
jgi:hypothetical protein